nr:polysaccharide deacetylase family protein [Halorhodospira neutriphila]
MPDTRIPERDYILGVLLGDFLGLSWRRTPGEGRDNRITLAEKAGEIRLPDSLLSMPAINWLTEPSMPRRPLLKWSPGNLANDTPLIEAAVPVIYGDSDPATHQEGDTITLPVDIFGSAFFMLSRYEELVTPERDEHNRFPAWASLAYQEGFLERPIVDEYVELLWAAMSALWPGLRRKRHRSRTFATCDVDSAIAFRGRWQPVVRRMGGDVLKRHSPRLAMRTAMSAWRTSRGNLSADPHWAGLQWQMTVNEQLGQSAAFYFIPQVTDDRFDKPVSLDGPRMRSLLREIHDRGHEIGIHPGYQTCESPELMGESAKSLRYVLDKEGIQQRELGGRQHYLRWRSPTTGRLWEAQGLSYDSTLSYADQPGFRCGTCREYPLFDLERRTPLELKERPLIVMECSVIADKYLGMGYSDSALEYMLRLRETCHRFGGDFTFLWHNSHLSYPEDKRFYRALLEGTA